jgi:YD repeat-containing protein
LKRRADGSWAGVTLNDAGNLYSYDALSQITGITPTTSNQALVPYAFKYNADGRLLESILQPGETREAKASYTYDANGNRTQEKLEGSVGSQTNNTWMLDGTNRLASHSQFGAYYYDAAGNNVYSRSTQGPMDHRYDPKKRLVETTIGNVSIKHTYDALGQRISRTEKVEGKADQTTLYFYDENGLLLGEYDDKGTPIQETVYLNNRPIATVKNGQIYAIWADHLGTPRIITGPST